MSDNGDPILAMMLDHRDKLAFRIAELQAELVPALADCQRLDLAIAALTGNALPAEPERHLAVVPEARIAWVGEQHVADVPWLQATGSATVERHVRNPLVQAAIDAQAPSVAIPRGTHVECMSCIGTESHHTFPDLLALRTHTTRHHDREPTEAERTPK